MSVRMCDVHSEIPEDFPKIHIVLYDVAQEFMGILKKMVL